MLVWKYRFRRSRDAISCCSTLCELLISNDDIFLPFSSYFHFRFKLVCFPKVFDLNAHNICVYV